MNLEKEYTKAEIDYLNFAHQVISKNAKMLAMKFPFRIYPELQRALALKDLKGIKYGIDRVVDFLNIAKSDRDELPPSLVAILDLWDMDKDQYPKVYENSYFH